MSDERQYHVSLHYSCMARTPEDAVRQALAVGNSHAGLTVEVFGTETDQSVLEGDHGQFTELPRITNDTDWVDLAVGTEALLIGKLDTRMTEATMLFTVRNAAWEQFLVDSSIATTPELEANTDVVCVVERTEDGLFLVSMKEMEA